MPYALTVLDSIASRARLVPGALECTRTNRGAPDSVRVHVAGELDTATSPMLERMLRSEELHAQRIVLDVREVTFMDSAGVRVIAAASARARRAERPLILVRAPSHDNRALTGNSNVQQIGDLDLPLGWSPQRIGLRSVARSLMRVGPRQIGDAW